jgi:hypothetical protein
MEFIDEKKSISKILVELSLLDNRRNRVMRGNGNKKVYTPVRLFVRCLVFLCKKVFLRTLKLSC